MHIHSYIYTLTYIHAAYMHSLHTGTYLLGVWPGRVQEGQQSEELPLLHIARHSLRHSQGADAAQT